MECLVGLHISFTGLRDFPYLNGENGYVTGHSSSRGRDQLWVRVESPKVQSVPGCPTELLLDSSRLIASWPPQRQRSGPQMLQWLRRSERLPRMTSRRYAQTVQ